MAPQTEQTDWPPDHLTVTRARLPRGYPVAVTGESHVPHGGRRRPDAITSARYDEMLVATRSFAAVVDGQPERITAGQSHVRASHALIARYPDAWRPL
jgi:hypothetical protein